jgi:hypothetical protein
MHSWDKMLVNRFLHLAKLRSVFAPLGWSLGNNKWYLFNKSAQIKMKIYFCTG